MFGMGAGGGMSSSNQDHTSVAQSTDLRTGGSPINIGGITRGVGVQSEHIAIAAVAVVAVFLLLK